MPDKGVHNIVSRLKSITGGDSVTVGRKHIKNIPMRLRMKIIMLSNLFVPLPDNSGALNARLIPLKLTKSFVNKEDTKLAAKLKAEYPAILLWALEGLRRLWQADGRFTLAQSTRDMQEQLLAASAPLQRFLEDCCELDSRKGVQTVALYDIYKIWFKESHPDQDPLSDGDFRDELRAAAPTIDKKRAKKPGERQRDGCAIVETDFDAAPHIRAYLWLRICPKVGYRTKNAEHIVSPSSAPAISLAALVLRQAQLEGAGLRPMRLQFAHVGAGGSLGVDLGAGSWLAGLPLFTRRPGGRDMGPGQGRLDQLLFQHTPQPLHGGQGDGRPGGPGSWRVSV